MTTGEQRHLGRDPTPSTATSDLPDASRAPTDAALRRLEVSKGRERHLETQVETLERRLLEAESRLGEMQREVERASARVEEIWSTTSWRVTAPLRWASRLLRRS